MGRVPKCKECKSHKAEGIAEYVKNETHWCIDSAMRRTPAGQKWIKGSEMKTSPKWCPKRMVSEASHAK